MTADAPVRELIARSGLGRTLFVEAGAGTGKTSSLVERIANLVLAEGVSLTNVAAITFTDAAAAELRDRVRLRFERELRESADPVRLERATAALADTDLAAISTLHSFAQRILGEHPARSGLPPRVGVLDEVASTLERERRWERFVDGIHDDPANEAVLERAASLGIALEPSYPGHATFKDVALRLDESWDRLGPVASHPHPPLPPVDVAPVRQAVARLEAELGRCSDTGDALYCRLAESVLPEVKAMLDADDAGDQLRLLAAGGGWRLGHLGRAEAWSGDAKAARAAVAAVEEVRAELVAEACHEVLVRLTSLVAADLLEAAEHRRSEGRLQFHDLLVLAKRLLETSAEARDALHRRYTRLLLDEFQDTDPLQIHLAVLIAASITGLAPDRWEDAEVPEGRLFFVGDPKQSIYRFRRADIELFLAARDRFGSGDATQRLSSNFRTVAPVIEWINALFADLMPAEVPTMQPAYEPLHAVRTPPDGCDARPVLLGGPHEGLRASEIRAAEASEVAAVLDHIRRHPDLWPVGDADEPGGWRPARLGDVTILIPTRTELTALEQALRDRHLPFHLATGTLIFESQEVRDAVAVLEAVADPSDELALVASLRSPLYGCSDVDLAEFHAAGGRWELHRLPPESLAPDHPVIEALTHLRSLWERRWWEPTSTLLTRLLRERAAAVLAFGDERPAEVWSRLRYLVDQVRMFEESGGGDLRQLLQWAELQRSETVTVHQPVASDGATDAVSVMTIHGAKGLEFPITVLSGMSARPPAPVRGANVIFEPDGPPGVALRKGVATRNHRHLAELETDMATHERLRLLYVAATRARDHLIVSCHHGGASFARTVWDTAQAHPETWRRPPGPTSVEPAPATHGEGWPTATAPPVPSGADRDAWAAQRAEVLAQQGRRRVISATAVARQVSGVALAEEDTPVDPTIGGPLDHDDSAAGRSEPARRRGRAGTAIGRAVHATLQLVDLHHPATLQVEATRQAHLEAIPELAGVVADMARSALEADAVRSARRYHREVYVAAPVGDHVLEGYVDLLVEGPGGLVVVDYKTDTVRSETEVDEKLAGYELQGAAYAVALEATTGLPVVACRFVFCRPAGVIEREVSDLPAAMARVRSALGEAPGQIDGVGGSQS
jgi:ATP-dependent helicase/nuclease subunit A